MKLNLTSDELNVICLAIDSFCDKLTDEEMQEHETILEIVIEKIGEAKK